MKILLDSHAFQWWCDGDERLSHQVRAKIEDETTEIYVSAASVWEIATKARMGKLPNALAIAQQMPRLIAEQGFARLAISIDHAHRAGWFDSMHRDAFDRMLAAQSLIEQMPVATNDAAIAALGANILW